MGDLLSEPMIATTETSADLGASAPDYARKDDRPYVYLCSPAHSGSTLIACLSAAHPEISTVGEFGGTIKDTGKCSCSRPYGECDFWRTFAGIAANQGVPFTPLFANRWKEAEPNSSRRDALFYHQFEWRTLDRIRDVLFYPTSKRRAADRFIANSVHLAELLCDHEHTFAFLDTTKYAGRMRYLLRQRQMPVKVIQLFRDGRGTVMSLMKWYGKSLSEAVSEWLWSIRKMRRAMRYASPDRVLSVRYEDFAQDPQEHTSSLFSFCGVDPDAPLEFSPQQRHIVGNTMRITFDGTIRKDESWRQRMTREQRDYFDVHAGAVNRSLGYGD
jgi:hypothetical protein